MGGAERRRLWTHAAVLPEIETPEIETPEIEARALRVRILRRVCLGAGAPTDAGTR